MATAKEDPIVTTARALSNIIKDGRSQPSEQEAKLLAHILPVTVNVFFDGTLNNYYNTKFNMPSKGGSYANAHSNIARMWMNIMDNNDAPSVYIEGIGTERYKADNKIVGAGFGAGETGVAIRAESAFSEIVKKLKIKTAPPLLVLNVFGFSRGAAAARYFIHLVNTQPELFKSKEAKIDWQLKNGISQTKRVNVNFVGLFDTVSSYSPGFLSTLANLGKQFDDDTKELHLNFSHGYANKVFHLTAGNEYRANFALTHINSALKLPSRALKNTKMGYELEIPGAHSDVGGGYNTVETEERSLLVGSKEYEFLVRHGWYHPEKAGEVTQVNSRSMSAFYLKRKVSNEYYIVGLTVMVKKALQYTSIPFTSDLTAPAKDGNIRTLQEKLTKIAKEESATYWWMPDNNWSREMRHWYFHTSFDVYSVGNVPTSTWRGNLPIRPKNEG